MDKQETNKKIWILTNPRSGSSYLANIMNLCFGFNIKENIREAIKSNNSDINNIFDSVRYEKIHYSDFKKLKKELDSNGHYIILERNPIESAASLIVAKTTGTWIREEPSNIEPESISDKELIRYCKYFLKVNKQWEKEKNIENFIKINYSELSLYPENVLGKISEFTQTSCDYSRLKLNKIEKIHDETTICLTERLSKLFPNI